MTEIETMWRFDWSFSFDFEPRPLRKCILTRIGSSHRNHQHKDQVACFCFYFRNYSILKTDVRNNRPVLGTVWPLRKWYVRILDSFMSFEMTFVFRYTINQSNLIFRIVANISHATDMANEINFFECRT